MLSKAELHPASSQSDYDTGMGMLALLGAASGFGTLPLNHAVAVLHGALKTENFRIYLGSNGRPSAAVIWAYLNEEAARDYERKGLLKSLQEWNSGDQLWFLHVIAEGGKVRAIMDDCLQDPLFEEFDCAYMLRAAPTGRRRIVRITRRGIKLVQSLSD